MIENARTYGLSERRRQWLEAAAELNEALQPPIDARTRRWTRWPGRAPVAHGATAVAVLRGDDRRPAARSRRTRSRRPRSTGAPRDPGADHRPPTPTRVDRRPARRDVAATLVPLRTHLVAPAACWSCSSSRQPRPRPPTTARCSRRSPTRPALALDRAQALEDRAELAVTSDRERIARDLHDLVIQRLFATGLQLQGADARRDDREVADRIDDAVDALDVTIRTSAARSSSCSASDQQPVAARRPARAGARVRARC